MGVLSRCRRVARTIRVQLDNTNGLDPAQRGRIIDVIVEETIHTVTAHPQPPN